MGKPLFESIEDWAEGVNTTVEADELPPNASPRGRNSALVSAGQHKAIVQKRRGMSTMNRTAITGAPAVIGQYAYNKLVAGVFTQYHLLVSDTGRLDKIDTSGTLTSIGSSAFTSGTNIPDFQTANNLAFIINGVDRKKFNGSVVQNFGIVRPVSAPSLAAGAAGNHNGTYEARVTYVNAVTGHESSAGPTSGTVTVANKKLSWTAIPVSADTQVDTRKLYIRNTTTQAEFFLVATISDNTATTLTTDVLDTALSLIGPDTAENDPPPSGIKYLAWFGSRMFVADDTTLFFSGVGLPESFDPDNFEPVNTDDGQKITGLHAAQEVLIIFKSNATYALDGTNPQSWTIRLIDPKIGCTSHRSITTIEGVTYWWSEQGPVRWDGANPPQPIGVQLIGTTVAADNLNYSYLDKIIVCADLPHERLMFAVPELNQTRNTMILPFNIRLQRWESDKWDPMDIASMAVVDDSNGQPWVYMGGYGGQIFKWWNADNDGIFSGTSSGSFVQSGTSLTVITDLVAAFDTTGAGLKQRKITIVDSDGQMVGTLRSYVSSNTATTLTLTSTITGLTSAATYTYVVGGPDFSWDTLWDDNNFPYHKKRFEYLFIQCKATSSAINIGVDLAFNFDTSTGQSKAINFSSGAVTATWDVSLWDSAAYGTQSSVNKRLRIGRTGRIWRARIRNRNVDQPVTLQKIGIQAELLTTNA